MASKFGIVLFCSAIILGGAGRSDAASIVAPVSATIDVGGPGFGLISETFDQSGLSAGYTSGVTDFDDFLAGDPTHTSMYSGYEWFSNEFETTGRVTYDLGQEYLVSRLALWNEESSGIGVLNLSYSVNGTDFFALASNLVPSDNIALDAQGQSMENPLPPFYLADVFPFAPTNARYIRFDMSQCAQGNDDFEACAIGEVAFDAAAVPEPATIALVGGGLAAMRLRRRRRARA